MLGSIDVAKRVSKCQHCPLNIIKGGVRMCKDLKKSGYNHPSCYFRYLEESGNDIDIPNVDSFLGVSDLETTHHQQLIDLVIEYNRNKTIRNTQAGASNPPTPINTLTTSPTTQPSYSQAVGVSPGTVVRGPVAVLNASTRMGGPSMGNLVNSFSLTPQSIVVADNIQDKIPVNGGIVVISSDEDDANNPTTSNRGNSSLLPGNLTSTPKPCPPAPHEDRAIEPTPKRQKMDNGSEEDETVCSICLDPPVHPVKLPCSHMYCYLCAKGLVLCDRFQVAPQCSLCRQDFQPSHLESSLVLQEASSALNNTPPIDVAAADQDYDIWQWFYQGNKGWWRFEERNNEDLEKSYLQGEQRFELLICGKLYTIDFVRMEQFQTQFPQRKRHIKRDLRSTSCKGVAGLVKTTKSRS
jgi:E3 ubiquitin-protein ligase RNF146